MGTRAGKYSTKSENTWIHGMKVISICLSYKNVLEKHFLKVKC